MAIAKVVFTNREHIVVVRAVGEKLLGMTVLENAAQVRQPAAFASEVYDAEVGHDEAKLARELLEGMTDAAPDLSQYRHRYVEKLKALIEARVEGQELVAPPEPPPPPVFNLMDALIASLEQVKKPPRKMAASAKRSKKAARRKSKTG